MTPRDINMLCQWLIDYRDRLSTLTERSERDRLADVCNALDAFAKQTRTLTEAFAKVDDPGVSDLDDEQPMPVHIPLGALRRARRPVFAKAE